MLLESRCFSMLNLWDAYCQHFYIFQGLRGILGQLSGPPAAAAAGSPPAGAAAAAVAAGIAAGSAVSTAAGPNPLSLAAAIEQKIREVG